MSLTREQKRRRQRIRANLTGLAVIGAAVCAGALLGGGAAYSITEPVQPDKATFRSVVVQTSVEAEEPQEPDLVSIGTFTVYAYCPCEKCCGQWSGGPTASGVMPEEGRTVAADWNVLPAGTEIYIDGIGWRTVEDTGSGITGDKLDLYMDSHEAALKFGVREIAVYARA